MATRSYRCCDPLGQPRAEQTRHRLGQFIGREKPRFDDFPAIGERRVERVPDNDMDRVACAVQLLFGKLDMRRPLQGATSLLQQFALRRAKWILACS